MEKLKSLNKSTKKTKENNKKDAIMNDAAAAAYDAVSDGVSDVKDAVGKFVQFDANKTNFFIKLRKNLDVKFPGIQRAKHHHHHHHRFPPLCARKIAFVVFFFPLLFFKKSRRAFSLSSVPNNSCRADSKLALPSRDGFVPRLPRRQPVHGFNGRIHAEFTMVL